MRRVLVAPLALIVVALWATPTSAQSGVSVCGRVTAFTAATPTNDGSITIGTRSFVLRADALYSAVGQNRETLVVGREICLQGQLEPPATFVQYLGIRVPAPFCGTVMSFTASTATAAGVIVIRDVGEATFPIPAGSTFSAPAPGQRICVTLGMTSVGDAFVQARSLTVADRTVARTNWCGLVSAWTAPTGREDATLVHLADGSIAVGSRTFAIAAGTIYSLVNATPVVGQPTCLSGSLDADGRLIEYGAQPFLPACVGGALASFRPATSTAAGEVRFLVTAGGPYTDYSFRYAIPAGTVLPADAGSGSYCFTLTLGATNDVVVSGARPAEGGGAASSNIPPRNPPTLPNTSTAGERFGD
jgi:hypothetical protein